MKIIYIQINKPFWLSQIIFLNLYHAKKNLYHTRNIISNSTINNFIIN